MVARSEYLGSADAASLVSLEPYGCRRQMVYKKVGLAPDNAERERVRFSDDEGPVARGVELEEKVRERIRKKIGPCYEWMQATALTLMPHRPAVPAWFGATPDGIVGPLDEDEVQRLAACLKVKDTAKLAALTRSAGILEAKTVQQADLWRILKGGPREDHILQVQHQLAATAAPWALLAYLNADQWRWSYHFIERDEAWERETYLPAAYAAWDQVTRARTGIDLGASPDTWEPFLPARLAEGSKQCRSCPFRQSCWGSEYLRIMEIPVEGDAVSMDGNPEWEQAVQDYLAANEILADAEEIKDGAAEKIKAMLGDLPAAQSQACKVYYRPTVQKRLDTTALKKALPEVAAQFTKDVPMRALRIFPV